MFFVCDKKMNKIERNIFGVFYFFIIEKVRIAFRQEKKLHKVYRKCQNCFQNFVPRITTLKMRYILEEIEADEDEVKVLIEAN